MPEDAIPIAQQITWRTVPRESLPELLCSPLCSRMCGDREVKDTPTLVRKNEEYVEDLKPDRRDGKEVYGHKATSRGCQGRFAKSATAVSDSDEILAHARLPDVDAELQKLAVDARRSPAWILFAHAGG